MKRSRFSDEQIIGIVKEQEAGQKTAHRLHGRQVGALAAQDDAPSRFVFGDDARQWAGAKVDRLRHEIARSADHN
nr:hypothetical protein [Martelella mediterranea]